MSSLFNQQIYKLEFDGVYDVVLCLDSTLPPLEIFYVFSDKKIIAADGAALRLLKMGIEPDYIVGDLDTFNKNPLSKQIPKNKLFYQPDQQFNDFEKCLKFALKKKIKSIIIFGFHGGELEHTLNNWSVLKKYSKKIELCLYDKGRYALPLYFPVKLKLNKGEMISLLPQPKVKITTKNLMWELNNEILELGVREGARNIAIKQDISLIISEGELLLFLDDRLPNAPRKLLINH